jgi:hypothetical protein
MTAAPILFLIFNRPDTTAVVMEAIRAARCPRLYVAADGPRERAGEADLCAKARLVATAADWPCQVHTLFREQNWAAAGPLAQRSIGFSITRKKALFLRTTVFPRPTFFDSAANCCHDSDGISASWRFAAHVTPNQRSIWKTAIILHTILTCGDGRRAWQLYDRALSRWPQFRKVGGLRAAFNGNAWREAASSTWFDLTAAGEIDTWDYQWIYTVIEQAGLACYPTRNLVSNLGYRADAAHTVVAGNELDPLACRAHQPLRFPLELVRSEALERELEELRLHYLKNWAAERLKRRMRRRRLERILRLLPTSMRTALTQLRAVRVRWIKQLERLSDGTTRR